jgi:8-oxo-dGTP diphosphatase
VILRGESQLVTEQSWPQVEFQLPGGGIDPGESMLAALHRECFEETGWRIRVLRRLGAFQRYTFMPEYDLWARKVCHVFLALPALRLGPPVEPGHRAVWMPRKAAARRLGNAGDRDFVSRLRIRTGQG